ncbi:MAG: glycosyltransferase family 39 protein [Aquificaceae bacterium]|nr:glycosyltransferase family 39 protein [Aquificaceae bacterium]
MILILVLILISPLAFLGSLYFVNEESLRVLLAFELNKENFIRPTLFGEKYLNKPPMFPWLLSLMGNTFGFGEFQMRIISVIAFWVCTLAVIIYAKNYWSDYKAGLIAGILFSSSGSILFFYSSLAEIDMVFTMAVVLGVLLSCARKRAFFVNLFFAFAMMLKGLAALSFIPGAFLVLAMRQGLSQAFKKSLVITGFSLMTLGLWVLLTKEPILHAQRLLEESFGRVSKGGSWLFLLENFKDMLPASALALFALSRSGKVGLEPLLIGLVCYLPYIFSDAEGRYVMPVFAFLAVAFAKSVSNAMQDRVFERVFYSVLILTVALKLIYSGIYSNFMLSRGDSPKSVASSLKLIMANKTFSCQCEDVKSTCLYLSLEIGKPATKDGDFKIVCEKPSDKRAIGFRVKSKTAWLSFGG